MRILLASLMTLLMTSAAMAETPKRIVSIGGALTEIVYALNAGDMIVGSDTTSYYPKEAEALPKVGYQRALSAEGVLSLQPDLVLLSNESGPATVLEQLKSAGLSMATIDAGRSVDDVLTAIRAVGRELDKTGEAEELVAGIEQRRNDLTALTAAQETPKKVLFILSHGGGAPMVAGQKTAADSIIALAGAENAVNGYEGYKPLTPEAAVALQPDVILITNRGLQGAGGIEGVKKMPGISLTRAAQEDRIIAMDSLKMLGFGPRTIEAAIELNEEFYRP